MSVELPPRLTDATILLTVATAVVSGLIGLVTGDPRNWWVFALHGGAGFVLVVLLTWKFRRVYRRVTHGDWNRTIVVSVLTTMAAVAALMSGFAWVFGLDVDVAYWNLMNVHILFGLLVVPLLVIHLRARFRLPDSTDFQGRRTMVQYVALAGFGAVAWPVQGVLNRALSTAGADRRFTGSRRRDGDGWFPVTMWMLDDPAPVDVEAWSLSVTGAVSEPYELGYEAVSAYDDEVTALLDCTSGWYTEQNWTGIRVDRLLDRAGLSTGARYVTFRSITGYRWTLRVEEARDAMLATGIEGDPLDHGHGYPLRLVAPGRRGFQWVKWVETVEVRTEPDPGKIATIFLSGLW